MAVDDLVVLVEHQVNLEERELLLLGSKRADFRLRVILVLYNASPFDDGGDWQEPVDRVDVVPNRAASELEDGVLHEVALLDEELAELAHFVGLFASLGQVEPGAATFGAILVVGLNDLLDLGHPCLLQIVGGLGDRGGLDLVKVIDAHRVVDVRVENVTFSDIVALLSDLLLGTDNLVLDLEGLEAVLRECLRKGVLRHWDADHTLVGRLLFL